MTEPASSSLSLIGGAVMSKDTSKIKNKLYSVAALLFAVAVLAAGICGVVFSRVASREYKNSEDIRKVTAVVTDYKDIGDDEDYGDYKYRAKLAFDVDGKTYKGTETYYRKISKGDKVTVEVYRTSKGTYKLSPDRNPVVFLVYCIAIPVGGFLTVAMAYSLFTDNSDKKAAKGKKAEAKE